MNTAHQPKGMLGFTIVWFGQLISLVGSAMSGFALTIYAWKITDSATALAVVGFFNFAPMLIFSPFAGVWVDRWNRKLVMMLSDLAAGLSTIMVLLLYLNGSLQIWHLCALGAFASIFQAFQWPAYSAAISLMIPKEHYGRASGMISLAEWGSGIFAPVLASFLIAIIDISGILLIDIATFVIAIGALLVVFIPQPPRTEAAGKGRGNFWKELLYGFEYIFARPSLLGLQLVFFTGNFLSVIGMTVLTPMILARTSDNSQILGAVQSAGAAGGVAGSLLLTAWGGPKKRIHGVLGGWALSGLANQLLMGLGGSLPFWLAASFMGSFIGPIINGSNQAIWQSKVAPDIQGRVFSIRRLIAQITAPLGMLLAGPLADQFFEPAMAGPDRLLGGVFGGIFSTGPGTGMSMMIAISGVLVIIAGLAAFTIPRVYHVETLLPDHQADSPT